MLTPTVVCKIVSDFKDAVETKPTPPGTKTPATIPPAFGVILGAAIGEGG
jgi:hypothetical protein